MTAFSKSALKSLAVSVATILCVLAVGWSDPAAAKGNNGGGGPKSNVNQSAITRTTGTVTRKNNLLATQKSTGGDVLTSMNTKTQRSLSEANDAEQRTKSILGGCTTCALQNLRK